MHLNESDKHERQIQVDSSYIATVSIVTNYEDKVNMALLLRYSHAIICIAFPERITKHRVLPIVVHLTADV